MLTLTVMTDTKTRDDSQKLIFFEKQSLIIYDFFRELFKWRRLEKHLEHSHVTLSVMVSPLGPQVDQLVTMLTDITETDYRSYNPEITLKLTRLTIQ